MSARDSNDPALLSEQPCQCDLAGYNRALRQLRDDLDERLTLCEIGGLEAGQAPAIAVGLTRV